MTKAKRRFGRFLLVFGVGAALLGLTVEAVVAQSTKSAVRYSYAKDLAPLSTGDKTILAQAAQFEEFGHFVRAMQATRFASMLEGPGPYTLFAFSNEAFERLPDAYEKFLFTNEGRAKLEKIMAHHIVPGRLLASSMRQKQDVVETLEGRYRLTVDGRMRFVRVNGTTILGPDILAANGVIHLIDYVIIPPDF